MNKEYHSQKLEKCGYTGTPGFEKRAEVNFYRCLVDFAQLDLTKLSLDIGCGKGFLEYFLMEYMNRNISNLICLEIDIDRLREAKTNTRSSCHYIHGDSRFLPIRNNSVSNIFCIEVIEHIRGIALLLQEIQRIMYKKGRCVISTPNAPRKTLENIFAFLKIGKKMSDKTHIHEYEIDELDKLVRMCGLQITKWSLLTLFRDKVVLNPNSRVAKLFKPLGMHLWLVLEKLH